MIRRKSAILISNAHDSHLQALVDSAANKKYPAEISLIIADRAHSGKAAYSEKFGVASEVLDYKSYSSHAHFEDALSNVLAEHRIELLCLIEFWHILSVDFVNKWKNRCINLHPSLLPSFKGFSHHEDALNAGVRVSGCTVHFVVPEVDAGPIILQEAVNVYPDDTPEKLTQRMLPYEQKCLIESLKLLASDRLEIIGNKVYVREECLQTNRLSQ